jgi:hypothetical protein
MGKIAVTIIGTVVGAYFGYPQLGFLLGSLVGTLAFPDKGPNMSGPRLDNLMVTSSTYGQPIPIVYGTFRLAGNMIWSNGIREVVSNESAGGKGGGGATITNYSYRWSGAIAICSAPVTGIGGLLRIWADSKVVYDATGASPIMNKDGFVFRMYLGDEEQMPDPAWEAAVGAGNLSANRGIAYIVFDDIPLQDYGNRIPNFTFEVAGTGAIPDTTTADAVANIDTSISQGLTNILIPDWDHNVFYRFHQTDGIRVYNISDRQEIRRASADEVLEPDADFSLSFGGAVTVDSAGMIYAALSFPSNSRPIAVISGSTLREIDRATPGNVNGLDPSVDMPAASILCVSEVATLLGPARWLTSSTFQGDLQFFAAYPNPLTFIGYKAMDHADTLVVGGNPEGTGAVVYAATFDTSEIQIHKVIIQSSASNTFNSSDSSNSGLTSTLVATLQPPDIENWTHFQDVEGMFWDEKAERLYLYVTGLRVSFLAPNNKDVLVRFNPETGLVERVYTLEGAAGLKFNNTAQGTLHNRITDERLAIIRDSGANIANVQVIDLATGVTEDTGPYSVISSSSAQVYNGSTGEIIHAVTLNPAGTETNVIISTGRRIGVPALLSDIVTDLCGRAGLEPTDIDVTELIDEVPGYLINAQMSVRSAIEPLAVAYKFDGVESDYLLKFLKRGRASTLTITQDKLKFIDENSGDVIRETRVQEVDMPERVSVVYADPDRDYQQSTQTSKRITNPTPTMFTKNQATMTLPISLSATFAKQLSYTMLNVSWIERIATEFQTGWEYLKLDPVDSITINLDNGTVYRVRLIQADVGVDLSSQFQAVNEKAAAYTSAAALAGDTGGFESPVVPSISLTRTFIFDSPMLRDQDDPGQLQTIMYCMAGNYGQPNWPGAEVQKSVDGSFYTRVSEIFTNCAWGACVNTLGDPVGSAFLTDETNTLSVYMFSGASQLESVTQTEMVNGANGAMVINLDTGIMEVIQFRDVSQNTDGTYLLEGLLRGRRGTDTYAYTHSGEEFFILLTDAAVEAFKLGLGEIDAERYYKGIQFGTLFEDADVQAITSIGRPLMPYAPVNYEVVDNAGDYDITWERRTRLAGDLLDGVGDVPLGEVTESYEVDIYDGTGTTVLRTLTSITTDVTYTSANITTDFGTPPATLIISVYQMSGAVGRGFAYKTEVTVA